jgi:hypothetical protein
VLVCGAGVYGLTVRDDDALEREVQQGAQGGQRPLLMRGRRPDTQFAPRRGQRVGENECALLGQPKRRLVAAPSVVECDDPSRKPAAGLDELQVSLGDVFTKKEARAKRAGIIAADEQIDVPNVIRLENSDGSWWASVKALPELDRILGRSERIEDQYLATGLDAG